MRGEAGLLFMMVKSLAHLSKGAIDFSGNAKFPEQDARLQFDLFAIHASFLCHVQCWLDW